MSESPSSAQTSRRAFVRSVGVAGLVAAAPRIGERSASAVPGPADGEESAASRLYKTLGPEQRKAICFPHDHPLRHRAENHWAIVGPTIGAMSGEQRDLCREILRGITSEDGFGRFLRQMREDGGGFESYRVALFGEPGTDRPFEWVLSGRHATLRADGNATAGGAFAGPIFYGHGSALIRGPAQRGGNVWWDQAKRAKAVFESLDGRQRALALSGSEGIRVDGLDASQKGMVGALIGAMRSPFCEADARGLMARLEEAGGVDALRLTYFRKSDGGVRDVWKVEGPACSWSFHGEPHVHGRIEVARPASAG